MSRSVTYIDNVGSGYKNNSNSDSGVSVGNFNPYSRPVVYDEFDYLCKLLVIGDSGCGKSSLLTRFGDNEFHHGYSSTIGVDFALRTVDVPTERGGNKVVKLQMWDTAGQERFRTITSSYYRGAHAVLLVCDVTSESSFASVKRWLAEIDQVHAQAHPDGRQQPRAAQVLLVANKTDLVHQRVVEPFRVAELAAELEIPYVESSAKSGAGVGQAFLGVAAAFVKQRMRDEAEGRCASAAGMHGERGLKVNGVSIDEDDDGAQRSFWKRCFGACSIM